MLVSDSRRVLVVGGGLAGLAAATYLARHGLSVTLFEGASRLGGRGLSDERQGFVFNLGPHALYARGVGREVLEDLGAQVEGRQPPGHGLWMTLGDELHPFPTGPFSLLRAPLPLAARFELLRFLGGLQSLEAKKWQGRSTQEWLGATFRSAAARQFVAALIRLSTYAAAPEWLDGGVALAQLQLALSANVLYLDGGWQSLVDSLAARAREAGVEIHTLRRAKTVRRSGTGIEVISDEGSSQGFAAVLVALPLPAARSLLDVEEHGAFHQRTAGAMPVHMACLDLALDRLPRPDRNFALGLDRPLYLSVHSASAALAPESGALVHVARYLHPEDAFRREDVMAELEALAERVQPGFRQWVVERRRMPRMMVTSALRRFDQSPHGVRGEMDGLYLAGDWVGSEGLLADASLASARSAASAVVEDLKQRKAA